MEFDIWQIREAYNKNDLNNQLLKDFMQYEKKYWFDHMKKQYNNELERCLDHIRNIINGRIKEIIFFKYFKKQLNLTYKEGNIASFITNRKHIGETDFTNTKGQQIELKAYDKYLFGYEIQLDLNTDNYKYKYHSADVVVFWFPYDCTIKFAYKKDNLWHIMKRDKNYYKFLEDMKSDYEKLRVSKFRLEGEQKNEHNNII